MENTINFGIDLGTTNSAIAKFVKGEVIIFSNPQDYGRNTLPSVVSYKKDKITVGNKAKEFLEHVWQTVDIAIENYLERDFEHLQINFGCTGGQHRSVYCAEQTALHLKNKYNAKVKIKHIERELQGQFI